MREWAKRIPNVIGGARTIRGRVLLIVLIPCVALLVVGVGGAGYLVSEGTQAKDYATKLRDVTPPSIDFIRAIEEERRLTMLRLGGDPEATALLGAQRGKTDQVLANIAATADDLAEINPEAMGRILPVLSGFLARFPETRKQVDDGQASPDDAYSFYNQLSELHAGAMLELARNAPVSTAAVEEALSSDLGQVADAMSRGNALGAGAIASGGLNTDQLREYRLQVGGYRTQLAAMHTRLPQSVQAQYKTLIESPAWAQLTAMENAIIERGPQPPPAQDGDEEGGAEYPGLPLSMSDWQNAAIQVNVGIVDMWSAQHAYAADLVVAYGETTYTNSLWGGIGVVVATIVVLLIALRLSNRLIGRLKRLRGDTLELAKKRLPELVDRLRAGKEIDLDHDVAMLDHGRDEIGQVADAFNTAQRTAAAAAVQEAKTREGVNSVFLNIAHRSQVVVHRQLEILDEAERKQEDPDQLELLFKLDHLATRSRRNAENLIILGGSQPGRQWRNPVPLVEITRSAVAETEEYARVRTGRLPALSMVGAVVADLVHLLAELVDNATSFSPPESTVEVRGNVVGRGVVIEVEDQGLGITKELRERLNVSLRNPPDFGMMALSGDGRLGLFVVARLAMRHGINVTLAESAYGGTRAIVLIRSSLIAQADDATDGGTPAVSQVREPVAVGAAKRQSGTPRLTSWDPFTPPDPAQLVGSAGEPVWPTEDRVVGSSPRHAQAPSGDTRPPLPRRQRQANLAPQLAAELTDPGPGTPEQIVDDRPAGQARDVMSAIQRGTRQGRDEQ